MKIATFVLAACVAAPALAAPCDAPEHRAFDFWLGEWNVRTPDGYDASRKAWHQTWVDTDGTLLLLEGGARDGRMILEGQTVNAEGPPTKHRITWSPNADGSVRQHWEPTDAKGQWTTAFDGTYTRK
jgi:hypothetical protein